MENWYCRYMYIYIYIYGHACPAVNFSMVVVVAALPGWDGMRGVTRDIGDG